MFEYNTRTEVIKGARFIEKDILMFDYAYTGDLLLHCDVTLQNSGFGFVIADNDTASLTTSSAIYMIKLNRDNSYTILHKSGSVQETIITQFVGATAHVYEDGVTSLFFEKRGTRLIVYKGIRIADRAMQKIRLLEYSLPYEMESYKIGIYSNKGNTLRFASIETEAPSNWVTNVFNANGGRIHWIKNGFVIENAEYDIEAESENIQLPAGVYYFAYETDNPDMKAYVYLSYRKKTDTPSRRTRGEIRATMDDEVKNILEDDGRFELSEDHAINIKFKGKWGTVKNICIKTDKHSDFVETTYDSSVRPASRIIFDLNKIKKVEITGTITSVPYQDPAADWVYYIFRRGNHTIGLDTRIQPEKEITYIFDRESGVLSVDGVKYPLQDSGNKLYAFYNVTAHIRTCIVTMNSGEEINILLQKTFKTSVPGVIQTPIIVQHENGEVLDLSSAYRLFATIEKRCELFHAWNPIHLKYDINLTDYGIKVFGIKEGVEIDKNGASIQEIANNYTLIPYTPSVSDLFHRTIQIDSAIKKDYKWIVVCYNAIVETQYVYTNWERELFDIREDEPIYLTKKPLHTDDDIIAYGIPKEEELNQDLLYYIPSRNAEILIDLCAYHYDNLSENDFTVTEFGKVIIDNIVREKYQYLIIDYLKKDSYSLNNEEDYWDIDISASGTKFKILYDAEEDGITCNTYQVLQYEDLKENKTIEEDDFVVIEGGL